MMKLNNTIMQKRMMNFQKNLEDKMGSTSRTIIGIDLGTTNCCVAVWNKEKSRIDVLTSQEGGRLIPSIVSFKKKQRLIGAPAKNEQKINPTNTVYEVKRLIGRRLNDKELKEDIKGWPFKLKHDGKSKRPIISVNYKDQDFEFKPEQISAFLLSKIASDSYERLKKVTREVVITVPAYFNNAQRKATKDAGKIALLDVVGMINEPTAAAIAYGLETSIESEKKILVYDLGGGTFDLSLLTISEGKFKVLATNGCTHLGGGDFDKILYNYAMEKFEENSELILSNERLKMNLMDECIKAKESLSSTNSTTIHLDIDLSRNISEEFEISVDEFNDLCKDKFDKTLTYVDRILKDSKLEKSQIDNVIMVGGSTRIPYIRNIVSEYFGGVKIDCSINPDEVVAFGAAIFGAKLAGVIHPSIQKFTFEDIIPLSLGIEVATGEMNVVVPRNTKIPFTIDKEFFNAYDNQEDVDVQVFEGENPIAIKNNLLGDFCLNDLTLTPAFQNIIIVTFQLDKNGILTVSAKEKNTGKQAKIAFKDSGLLTNEEIESLCKMSERFKEEDTLQQEKDRAKASVSLMIKDLKIKMKKAQKEGKQTDFSRLNEKIAHIEKFLKDTTIEPSVSDINKKKAELESLGKEFFG